MSISDDSRTRSELFTWLNSTFNLKITRCDQLSSGAIYCQVLLQHLPDLVYLKRYIPAPSSQQDIEKNYHLVELTLEKFGLRKRLGRGGLEKGSWTEHGEVLGKIRKVVEEGEGKGRTGEKSRVSTNASTRASTPVPAQTDVSALRTRQLTLTHERDCYFNKLSQIESLLQTLPDWDLTQDLLEVIYSSDDLQEDPTHPSLLPSPQP